MPIIKSAIKRARQQATRRSRNLQVKRAVHRDTREVLDAIATGDLSAATTALREAQSEIDRAVKKGALHKNTAARRKSRLSAQLVKLSDTSKPKAAEPKSEAKTATKAPAKKPAAKKPAAKKPAPKKTAK
jgi:small subunit ribosomal protein S20